MLSNLRLVFVEIHLRRCIFADIGIQILESKLGETAYYLDRLECVAFVVVGGV